jgi:hypothetical protein
VPCNKLWLHQIYALWVSSWKVKILPSDIVMEHPAITMYSPSGITHLSSCFWEKCAVVEEKWWTKSRYMFHYKSLL